MSENHPLAKQSSLTLGDLLYEEFVTLEHGQKGSYQEDLEERFQPYHVQPKIKLGYKMPMRYSIYSERTVLWFCW